ncbi:MAG: AAA family ATPase [Actinomycetota bacterium]|nr:AAA family ATPase [Actinomycetota bacterium]
MTTVITRPRQVAASPESASPATTNSPPQHPQPGSPGGTGAASGGPMVRIWLLGRFAVDHDGHEVAAREFGGALARRLLRMLALRRGTLVSKDLIADMLWPATPPADPAANIEVLVSRLRRALGDRGMIRTGPGGYLLPDGPCCWVDAEAFLAAVRAGRSGLRGTPVAALASFRDALGIWRGEPLPEDAYADWAQADRRQLALAHLEALDGAAAAALECAILDLGSRSPEAAGTVPEAAGTVPEAAGTVPEAAGTVPEAAAWAGQAVATDPLRESSVLLLARALHAAGDRAGALTALDEYRDRLAAETGLDPTPEATRLRQLILTGPATGPATRSASDLRQIPLVGRDEECAIIASAAAGLGPRAVLVSGPAGVGKSALLAEAAHRSGVPVLAVHAFAPDRDQDWSLAARLLCRAASQAPAPLSALLPGPEAAALAASVPGLAGLPNVPAGSADVPAAERTRALALRAAIRLIAAVAQPRCLIVADDLQWADPASLTMLGLLLRRLDGVGLAAGYRPEALPGADSAAALGLPAAQVAAIALGPLPDGLIADLFSDRGLAAAVAGQTARGPFTATEVIAALARRGQVTRDATGRWRLPDHRLSGPAEPRATGRAAAGPRATDRLTASGAATERAATERAAAERAAAAGLARAAADRLADLPAGWRPILGPLALLGRPTAPALLAAVTDVDLRAVVDSLEGLGSAGLVCPGPGGWELGHEVFRQVIVATMHPAEVARLHALLAAALHEQGADPAEIADHLAASGDRDRAALSCADAARRQLDRVHDQEAIRLARTGLSLDPPARVRAGLLEIRGEAHRRAGRLHRARADFVAALDCLDEPADRSRVLAQLAILDARTADSARGEELAMLAITEAGDQPAALGQALAAAAIIDLTDGDLSRARNRARRASQLLDQAGDSRGSARLLYWRAMAWFVDGRLSQAIDQLGHLVQLPTMPGEVLRLWSPRATLGHALALTGRAGEGLSEIEGALVWARTAGHPAVQAECLWRRAETLAMLGRFTTAIESAEDAAGIAARIGHAEWTAAAYRGLGIACEAAGLPNRAEAAYRRSLGSADGCPMFRAWAAARLGALLARQGRPDRAVRHVEAALAGGPPLTGHEARWARAELLASMGDRVACRAAALSALDRARDDGYLSLIPRLRKLAEL